MKLTKIISFEILDEDSGRWGKAMKLQFQSLRALVALTALLLSGCQVARYNNDPAGGEGTVGDGTRVGNPGPGGGSQITIGGQPNGDLQLCLVSVQFESSNGPSVGGMLPLGNLRQPSNSGIPMTTPARYIAFDLGDAYAVLNMLSRPVELAQDLDLRPAGQSSRIRLQTGVSCPQMPGISASYTAPGGATETTSDLFELNFTRETPINFAGDYPHGGVLRLTTRALADKSTIHDIGTLSERIQSAAGTFEYDRHQ